MPTFEMRCLAHGEYESASKRCPHGCPSAWQKQEIRTAPAYRRSGNMRFVDAQLKQIAAENGLTDMAVDPKDGRSVKERAQRRAELDTQALEKKTGAALPRQHWASVKHAAAGFSRDTKATVPTVRAADFGTKPSAAADFYKSPPPPPRPFFVGTPKD